ncbi:MAG TPA: hypothetical protein VH593_07645 [Ktedonobacteraceae bacterium]
MSKQCWIKARYLVKRTGTVCVHIVNERALEYTTCLHADGRASCTCAHVPSKKCPECYHIKHLRAIELARKEQVACSSSQPVNASNVSNASETQIEGLVAPMGNDTTLTQPRAETPVSQARISSVEASVSRMGLLRGQRSGGWLSCSA